MGSKEETSVSYIIPKKKIKPITWTGDIIDAVELAYAIWLSDHVNGGEADLYDIVCWLSQSLHIDLSRYTRLFSEIKSRKILSTTKFLDLMRDAVVRYIGDESKYQPEKRRAKRL